MKVFWIIFGIIVFTTLLIMIFTKGTPSIHGLLYNFGIERYKVTETAEVEYEIDDNDADETEQMTATNFDKAGQAMSVAYNPNTDPPPVKTISRGPHYESAYAIAMSKPETYIVYK